MGGIYGLCVRQRNIIYGLNSFSWTWSQGSAGRMGDYFSLHLGLKEKAWPDLTLCHPKLHLWAVLLHWFLFLKPIPFRVCSLQCETPDESPTFGILTWKFVLVGLERVQQFWALAALAEDMVGFLACTWGLTNICKPSSRGSNALSWPPRALHACTWKQKRSSTTKGRIKKTFEKFVLPRLGPIFFFTEILVSAQETL